MKDYIVYVLDSSGDSVEIHITADTLKQNKHDTLEVNGASLKFEFAISSWQLEK